MRSPILARAAEHPADDPAAGASQSLRAQVRLRELVVNGALEPGVRITELALVERLGMSRTPIRAALLRLQDEGLVEALPGGGFVVRRFAEADIHDAIDLRGTLEGLAARLAAERGADAELLAEVRQTLAALDALLAAPALSEAAFADYVRHNGRFHAQLSALSGSVLVQRQLERVTALPFASPNGFVMLRTTGPDARDTLVVAQAQHKAVVEAIVAREGARAEALMREHARIARSNLGAALQAGQGLQQLRGGGLLQPGGP